MLGLGKIGRAYKWLRVLMRSESAYKKGLEEGSEMSMTKLGAILACVGTLCILAAKLLNGEMDFTTVLPAALTAIGSCLGVFGLRNAISKNGANR